MEGHDPTCPLIVSNSATPRCRLCSSIERCSQAVFDHLKELENYFTPLWNDVLEEMAVSINPKHPKIGRSICIALGNPTDEYYGKRELWQLAMWLFITKSMAPNGKIPLFAQDPGFTHSDALLLTSLGITVLFEPEAEEHMTPDTFLFAPFVPYFVLLESFLKGQNPALLVTNNLVDQMNLLGLFPTSQASNVIWSESARIFENFIIDYEDSPLPLLPELWGLALGDAESDNGLHVFWPSITAESDEE